MKTKRTLEKREKDLNLIARLAIEEPLKSSSFSSFLSLVMEKLNLTESQAKRDIQEYRKLEKEKTRINYESEISKKLSELAMLKEVCLKKKNYKLYLDTLKIECELLGLTKLNIFQNNDSEAAAISLEEKRNDFLKKIEEMANNSIEKPKSKTAKKEKDITAEKNKKESKKRGKKT